MGVDISSLINPKKIAFEDLALKKIGIDAFNTLYQFISIIRQRDGAPLMDSRGRVTSHLSGLFYRTMNLLNQGLKPCFIFDGKAPEFKKQTQMERIKRRKQAKLEWEKALKEGDMKKAYTKATQSARLKPEMIEDSKKLLQAMGIPFIQAPSEGEAQAAHCCRKGEFFATASQDFDSLLFNTPRLVRNVTISGKRKIPGKEVYVTIGPEIIELEETLKQLGISREQLIILGILIGTDYNPGGVKGVGPKTAFDLVKKYKSMEVFSHIEWNFDTSPEDILNFFLNPPVTEKYSLKWESPDIEAVKKLLCDEHDFSEQRVENSFKKLEESKKKGAQSSLTGFF